MILNFGSLNIDHVYHVDHILREKETLLAAELHTFPGGKGLNQSLALARAGAKVCHAGTYGEGGEFLKDLLEENGVSTDYLERVDIPNGHTIIQVDKSGQNSILLYSGSNVCQKREHIDAVLGHFNKGDQLLLQNEINELPYIIEKAYQQGMEIILNPSPFDERLNACDFKKVSLFILNEVEASAMTKEEDENALPEALRKSFPGANFLLTLGDAGSVYIDQDTTIYQDIYKTTAVDTTAAGDTYTGFFLAARVRGKSIKESMQMASLASAIAVSRPGAATSIPYLHEVENRMLSE